MKKLLFILLFTLFQFSQAQSDCISAIPVCGDSPISYTPSGSGTINENLGGCLSGDEHYSVWYEFTVGTSGTLTFLITPNSQADYDWGVYGPNVSCNALGGPIRCSYASTSAGILTGLNMTATDVTEGAGGDGFCQFLTVTAGETYYLVVDNFSSSNVGFSLTWGGTATLNSPFNDPVIQPNPFIEPGPDEDGVILICSEPTLFDFSTLSTGILNGNPNFFVNYYNNANDAITGSNPILTPINVTSTDSYHYTIGYTDPTNPNNPLNSCKNFGTIEFELGGIVTNNVSLAACNNNDEGMGIWNLTTAILYSGPNVSVKYYPTIADANADTNEITSPSNYQSYPTIVYGLVTTQDGCSAIGEIDLVFYPTPDINEDTLISCFVEGNSNFGIFDLNLADLTSDLTAVKTYFTSLSDAVNNTNAISNTGTYLAQTSTVYVRIETTQGCWNITKIHLNVTSPSYSSSLVDQYICLEDRVTLDAGPGYQSYDWSTGETSQSITVGVGEYTVILRANNCNTIQTVRVMKNPEPVISNVDIEHEKVTIQAIGGTPPYMFSLDGVNWQESNIFEGIPRGQNIFYVKDVNDCEPISVVVTVPNLVNAITPNGDGFNDALDYSALGYKRNLEMKIYNRYGNLIHTADRNNGFRWDGKTNGREILTGTYWYHISWNEPNSSGTQVKFSGWIVVKNRD